MDTPNLSKFSDLPTACLSFVDGEKIVGEGDVTSGWYVLLSGKVGVLKGDHKVAEITHPGSVIGELGFLLDIPRTATLVAVEPTMVLHIRLSLDALIRQYPELAKRMMLRLAERLVKTTDDWREAMKGVEVV